MPAPLIVMLPGALMGQDELGQAGLGTLLAQHWPQAGLLPLTMDGDLLDAGARVAELHTTLEAIRRERQPAPLILGGISAGAALCLHYARRFPGRINSLCLLAPYPGSRITLDAIRQAGGPQVWRANAAQVADPDFQLWEWLREGHDGLPLYLGYGREDRFADGQRMMFEAAPGALCRTVAGAHDWPTWQALWQDFLQQRAHFIHATAQRH